MNQISSHWWWHDDIILLTSSSHHKDVICVSNCVNFKTIRFLRLSMQFSILIAVLFGSYITHFVLVDQNFGKPKFWQNFVIWTYIQASDFCCLKVSYCTPMFIINCKFLSSTGDSIMTSYWCYCGVLTMTLSFFYFTLFFVILSWF